MKLSTIEHYLKYTDKPYSEIVKKAKNGGLVVEDKREEGYLKISSEGVAKAFCLTFLKDWVNGDNHTDLDKGVAGFSEYY